MSGEASAKNQMETPAEANVRQAVPFFMVGDIGASMRYYVEGLGFRKTREWINEGKLEWCWLEIGGAALMLQEYREDSEGGRTPRGKAGEGVSVCFQCKDALAIYREATSRGIEAKEPFVGNGMWVVRFRDPDGYRIHFESVTDVPEETKLSEWNG